MYLDVVRSRKLRNKKYNGLTKRDERTNNCLSNTEQNIQD